MENKKTHCVQALTQSDILARGWTKGMINLLLPEPTLVKNKNCRFAPIKLWEAKTVEDIECTAEYAEAIKKVQKRREGAVNAADRKREVLRKEFETVKKGIHISEVDDNRLREIVMEERREHNIERGLYELYPEDAPEETKKRWIVNFIRHNLVNYDNTLQRYKGKVGIDECYADYKNVVLEKIASVYPQYADECIRQMI